MDFDADLRRDVSLSSLNTLALTSTADYVTEISRVDQLAVALEFARAHQMPWRVLGGGSNVILPAHLPGLVLLMRTRGITLLNEDESSVVIAVAAGEVWDDVVAHTLTQAWYGLENLSLIPGSCGAAPVQNIGAYGIEVAQFIVAVEYFDALDGCMYTVSANECEFRYRDSVFKHALRGRAIITCVHLRLSRAPAISLQYPALAAQFVAGAQPTPHDVRAAVIAVRRSKLPDPAVLPNVGSFFKNPVVSRSQFEPLQLADPALPFYPQADGSVKLAAGYLVEKCGWKGRADGPVQVHAQQALVLINRGGADATALLHTADAIRRDVFARYGVALVIEPDIL